MSRMRSLLPVLLSFVAVPAAADEYRICQTAADSLSCVIEQAEFARQRNLEIDASIATVARVRAFEKARNAEIDASIAAVRAERDRQLAIAQNALANAAMVAANAERERRFAAEQNALAEQSMAAVKAARAQDLALSLAHCKTPDSTTPRCEAERAQNFAAEQNALSSASMARVAAVRVQEFAAARNREINASIAAARRARAADSFAALSLTHCKSADDTSPRCAAEQSRELAMNLTHCKSTDDASPRCAVERAREFAAARNAEIDAALAAYSTARAIRSAEMHEANANIPVDSNADQTGHTDAGHMDTGALGIPSTPLQPQPERTLNHRISAEPCRAAGQPLDVLQFSAPGVAIDDTMKPALDRLLSIARACPDVRIELHGHSDAGGSVFVNRMLSQARAQAAADYLIGTGIAPNRLAVIGHGALEPLVPNTNEANRARNRRIEFRVKDPAAEAAATRVMWDLAELLDPTYVPQVARLSP